MNDINHVQLCDWVSCIGWPYKVNIDGQIFIQTKIVDPDPETKKDIARITILVLPESDSITVATELECSREQAMEILEGKSEYIDKGVHVSVQPNLGGVCMRLTAKSEIHPSWRYVDFEDFFLEANKGIYKSVYSMAKNGLITRSVIRKTVTH